MSEPGLLSRVIGSRDGDYVTVYEVWNLRAPGCPMIQIYGSDDVIGYKRIIPKSHPWVVEQDEREAINRGRK